jgi:hypothetical protein
MLTMQVTVLCFLAFLSDGGKLLIKCLCWLWHCVVGRMSAWYFVFQLVQITSQTVLQVTELWLTLEFLFLELFLYIIVAFRIEVFRSLWNTICSFTFCQIRVHPLVFPVNHTHVLIVIQHWNGFDCFFSSGNSPGVMTVILGNCSNDFMSLHFITEKGPECSAVVSSFFCFHFETFLLQLVYSQSVMCTVFSVLARQGEIWRLSIYTIWTCFSRGCTSFRTMAVVLLMPAVIKGDRVLCPCLQYKKGQVPIGSITQLINFNSAF